MFLKSFRGFFSSDIAIDLGTANTLIFVRDKGIVLNEPSVVAIRQDYTSRNNRSILAVGHEAKKMLKYFIRKVHENRLFQPSPRIVICVPCGSTQVERRAIREAAMSTGAREVFLIEEPMAAAIGADLPIMEPTGSMVLDIGGGTSEGGVISLGGVVYSHSLRIAGDKMDEAIVNYVRRKYGILIGEATAELVKKEIGTAWEGSEVRQMEIRGRHIADGVPRGQVLTSKEVHAALSECLTGIVTAIKTALEQTPPELGADVAEKGLVVSGGGALLRDIDRMLGEQTGLPIIIADDPLTCVVRGCGRALIDAEKLGDVFVHE